MTFISHTFSAQAGVVQILQRQNIEQDQLWGELLLWQSYLSSRPLVSIPPSFLALQQLAFGQMRWRHYRSQGSLFRFRYLRQESSPGPFGWQELAFRALSCLVGLWQHPRGQLQLLCRTLPISPSSFQFLVWCHPSWPRLAWGPLQVLRPRQAFGRQLVVEQWPERLEQKESSDQEL